MIRADEAQAAKFDRPVETDFSSACKFTAREYALFLMTESNVVAAIEYGDRTASEVLDHLEHELEPLFGGVPRRVQFAGYIQALRRH
jgi:hypothetical protein